MLRSCNLLTTLLSICLLGGVAFGQLFIENFSYTDGDSLTNLGWRPEGGITNPVTITSPGLEYPQYPGTAIGNAVLLDGPSGQDVQKDITPVSSGTVYMSFMVNVASATLAGDAFINLLDLDLVISRGRVFAQEDASGNLEFGFSKAAAPAAGIYTDNDYAYSTTYVIVLKYEFLGGVDDDEAHLFVFDTPSLPDSEPMIPDLGPDTRGSDMPNISALQLRQGGETTAPVAVVDGIRITTIWDDNLLPVTLSSFSAIAGNRQVDLKWRTESELNNVGFEVWRSDESEGPYSLLSSYVTNPDLEGQITTNVAHDYRYLDATVENGRTYWYMLHDIDLSGIRAEHGPLSALPQNEGGLTTLNEGIPADFNLYANFPNPFNPSTTLRFDVPPGDGDLTGVRLEIYNLLGQRVRTLYDGPASAGAYALIWDATNEYGQPIPGGVYIAAFRSAAYNQAVKMIYMK